MDGPAGSRPGHRAVGPGRQRTEQQIRRPASHCPGRPRTWQHARRPRAFGPGRPRTEKQVQRPARRWLSPSAHGPAVSVAGAPLVLTVRARISEPGSRRAVGPGPARTDQRARQPARLWPWPSADEPAGRRLARRRPWPSADGPAGPGPAAGAALALAVCGRTNRPGGRRAFFPGRR